MYAVGFSSIDSGRTAGGPNSSLENGCQLVTKLGIFEGAMIGHRGLVVNSRLGASVAVSAGAEFCPHRLQSHVAEDGVGLVTDDVDAPNKRDRPRSRVCRFSMAPPQDIDELTRWTFNCASVGHRFGPIRDDVRRGPYTNVHLPLPIAEDAVDVLGLGLQKPVAEKEHGRNAVIGPPLTIEGHSRRGSQVGDIL